MSTPTIRFVAVALAAFLGGCCSARVQIMEKEGADVVALSSSSDESCAYEEAEKKAKEYCAKRKKRFALVKDESKYQGMDKNAKGVLKGVGYATGRYIPTDSSDDYRVRLEFRCK